MRRSNRFKSHAGCPAGTRRAAEQAHRILEEGTSADRQRAVFRETGSPEAVVDHLMQETLRGVR